MPNPKTGTVTMDVGQAVTEVKLVKLTSRLTNMVLFMLAGKASFECRSNSENANEF